jgi:hypothetical protein
MLEPSGDRLPSDDHHGPDDILAQARAEAGALLRTAEEQAAAIERDGERRARRHVADAVRTGRERLAALAEEEREVARRLAEAQGELQAIVRRISAPSGNLIDLTGAEVRFGLPARPAGRRAALGEPAIERVPSPSVTVSTMVRRAVEEAVARGAARS